MAKTDRGNIKGVPGFAGMDPDRLKEVSSKGGKAVHAGPNAYRWTSKQAREAGRKGGLASRGGRIGVLGPKQPAPKPKQGDK